MVLRDTRQPYVARRILLLVQLTSSRAALRSLGSLLPSLGTMDLHRALAALMRPVSLPAGIPGFDLSSGLPFAFTEQTLLSALPALAANLEAPLGIVPYETSQFTPSKKARVEEPSSPVSSHSSTVSSTQDDAYFERRRKNNDAAKRSRDARRNKEEAVAAKAAALEQENIQLRGQIAVLQQETAKLQLLLFTSRTSSITTDTKIKEEE
ncbi:unnamed protein product [Caenorhabditis auriculariae]|uniref:BZIP domain-containing protein n=1 Tax=Caenorhabditis auriculariae TaxID=2777116 RepID=A0A8S1HY25_9PELO|nr:unnamed protein product [Caenorhabditis auriculariae]